MLDGLGDSYASGYGVAGSFTAPCGRSDVVTLPIGGNDIGWSQAVLACLALTDTQCEAAIDVAAPNATVYVTGYPRLF